MTDAPKPLDCRRCDNTGFVCCPCLEIEDTCVCEWHGEMPCPKCGGESAQDDLYPEGNLLDGGGEA